MDRLLPIKKYIKNNFLFVLIISYLIILLIPLFLNIGLYFISRNIIKDTAIQTQTEIINNVKTIIDKEIETVSRLGVRLSFDNNFSRLISDLENNEEEDIYDDLITAQKVLSNNLISDSIVEEIYVYLQRAGFVFTYDNKYTFDEFEYIIQEKLNLKKDELLNLLRKQNWRNFRIINDNNNKPSFVFLQSIPDTGYRDIYGTIIIKLNNEKIYNLIKRSIDTNKYIVGIIDKDNNYFITNGNKLAKNMPLSYNYIASKKQIFYTKGNNNDNLCIVHFPANNASWEYFSAFSLNILWEKINLIKIINLLYFVFCFIIGLITAVKLAKRNYNPIKRLIDKTYQNVKLSNSLNEDEFMFLDKIFENILSQNKKLSIELHNKNLKLIENMFVRLLKENVHNNYLYKFTKDIDDFKEYSKLLLVGIKIDEINDKVFKIDENEEEIELVYFVIKNVAQEILSSKFKSYTFEVDGKVISIISNYEDTQNNSEDYKPFLQENLSYIEEFLLDKFGINITIAVSKTYANIEILSSAYDEINSIFDYLEISKIKKRIAFYEDINKENVLDSSKDIFIYFQKILECIITKNYKLILDYNNELVEKLKENYNSNPKITKTYLHTYKNIIQNTIIDINTNIPNQKINNEIWKDVERTNDINILKELYDSIIETALYSQDKNNLKKPYWFEEVINFVNNNFNVPELSVDMIANKLNISSSHLSRSFKKFEGINLSDFIHSVRLEKVKKYLAESNLSIKEIAEITGYIDSKALIRVFKNYFGTTPSKYREENYLGNQIKKG